MKIRESLLCGLVLVATAALPLVAQNSDVSPDLPFQTVHLINMPSPEAEKIMLAAVKDLNAAIGAAACTKCVYHLWKVTGTQAGQFNYRWNSNWGRDVYDACQAATKKHEAIEKIMEFPIYNRYVEVTAGK